MSDYWSELAAEDPGDEPFGRPARIGAGSVESDDGAGAGEPEVSAEGGTSDPTGTVVVWTDADLRVVRVRVRGAWRDAALPPIGARVAYACRQATATLAFAAGAGGSFASPGAPTARRDLADLLAHPIRPETVAELAERTGEIREAAQALNRRTDVVATRIEHEPARGQSSNRKVSVSLNARMRPAQVSIDPEWARGVQAQRLVSSIEEALARAYAGWQPPRVIPGERDQLAAELGDLHRQTLAVVLGPPGEIATDR
ncbi:hypothetical protein [Granulicoccus phenolivorans]|uniref:hypothetical protein n=1 Tax=Granulicoccus phenolivorans TaxID=266854 RepID=UPI000413737C|nr:hypothetical protein [Granulicoccus phenolivorans]